MGVEGAQAAPQLPHEERELRHSAALAWGVEPAGSSISQLTGDAFHME